MRYFIVVGWLLLLSLGCQINKKERQNSMEFQGNNFLKSLESLRIKHHIPGLSVAIWKEDSLLLKTGLGFAKLEDRIPAQAETPYRIASITKPFAAVLLLQLRREGKLKLDAPFIQYYPDWPETFQRIKKYLEENEPEFTFLVADYEPSEAIKVIHHLTHTAQKEPGDGFQYNGFLYGRLAQVLEGVTDSSYTTLLEQRILGPLGMKQSLAQQAEPPRPELVEKLALPYHYQEGLGWQRSEFPNLAGNAGAGMISTVLDISIFDRALNQGQVLNEAEWMEATTPFQLGSGGFAPYGFGWFVQETNFGRVVWHTGWQPGAYSGLYLKAPEKKLTMILLANSEGLSAPFYPDLGQNILASDFARLFLELFADDK